MTKSSDLFLDGEKGIGIKLAVIIHLATPWFEDSTLFTSDSTGLKMLDSFAAPIAARFVPLDFTNVYGFPNTVPDIKVWEDVLPKFGEYADDNPAQHLFEFHKLMDELNIHHEDVLMKLFMFSLERDARFWYKSLPHSSIPSLKDFHILFHQHCKRIYSAEILFEDCCNIKFIIQTD
jgi:hypothetical protein